MYLFKSEASVVRNYKIAVQSCLVTSIEIVTTLCADLRFKTLHRQYVATLKTSLFSLRFISTPSIFYHYPRYGLPPGGYIELINQSPFSPVRLDRRQIHPLGSYPSLYRSLYE